MRHEVGHAVMAHCCGGFVKRIAFGCKAPGENYGRSFWAVPDRDKCLLVLSGGVLVGMGISYVVLLTAFYVDNGKNLPLWRDLPSIVFWLLPAAIGVPFVVRALWRHPLAQTPPPARSL